MFLKEFLRKINFEVSRWQQKHEKLPSMQRAKHSQEHAIVEPPRDKSSKVVLVPCDDSRMAGDQCMYVYRLTYSSKGTHLIYFTFFK